MWLILILNSVSIWSAAVPEKCWWPASKFPEHFSLQSFWKQNALTECGWTSCLTIQTFSLSVFAFVWTYAFLSFLQNEICLYTVDTWESRYFARLSASETLLLFGLWGDRIEIESCLVPSQSVMPSRLHFPKWHLTSFCILLLLSPPDQATGWHANTVIFSPSSIFWLKEYTQYIYMGIKLASIFDYNLKITTDTHVISFGYFCS